MTLDTCVPARRLGKPQPSYRLLHRLPYARFMDVMPPDDSLSFGKSVRVRGIDYSSSGPRATRALRASAASATLSCSPGGPTCVARCALSRNTTVARRSEFTCICRCTTKTANWCIHGSFCELIDRHKSCFDNVLHHFMHCQSLTVTHQNQEIGGPWCVR